MLLSWSNWLNQMVYFDTEVMKRHVAIALFCRDGLMPFIKREGYIWALDQHKLTERVLQLLYLYYKGKRVITQDKQEGWDPEHKLYYEHLLDTDKWLDFWDSWGFIDGFGEDDYAYNVRYTLPHHAWNWLNLEASSTVKKVEESLYDPEETVKVSYARGKDDPYLLDMMQGNFVVDRHY